MMKLYIDLDGVLCDFDRAVSELMGTKLNRGKKWPDGRELWVKINKAGEKFWSEMEWLPGGKKLWEDLKKYKPIVLSSPSRHESSRIGKRKWVHDNLGPEVEVILESKKEKHASPDALLVDDRQEVLNRWTAAGGVGVLHTDVDETIKKVTELMFTSKEAFKVEYVDDPYDPNSPRKGIVKFRGGRGQQVHRVDTRYDRAREKRSWKREEESKEGLERVILSYLQNDLLKRNPTEKVSYDDYKFRSHPVVIDPYDAIVQQAIQKMGPTGKNIDVVKLELTCPGNKVAWVTNEDFFHGKKDKKRVVHLCLNKIKGEFSKTHGKAFNMARAEDAKRMRELIVTYLRDVVLPHEEAHIEQEVKGKGKFGPSPEIGAERAEKWHGMKQFGLMRKAGFFPEDYDPETGKYKTRMTTLRSELPLRREAPFSFKRLRTQNLNYVRDVLLGLKNPKATKIWSDIEAGLRGDYSREQEYDLKRIIQEEARDFSLSVGELINNLFGNKGIEDLKASPVYHGISRKFARSVLIKYASQFFPGMDPA